MLNGAMDVDEPVEGVNLFDIAQGVPREVCLRIFSMLDANHLIAASFVSKEVRTLLIHAIYGQRRALKVCRSQSDFSVLLFAAWKRHLPVFTSGFGK